GAGDDLEIAILSCASGGFDLHHGSGAIDDFFAVHVAAALGNDLILELDRGGAGLFVSANQALDVERAAVAVVAVGDERHRCAGGAQRTHALDHLARANEADVGDAEERASDAEARHVDATSAGLRGDTSGERIVGAGRDDRAFGELGLEACARRHSSPSSLAMTSGTRSSAGMA